MGARALVLLLGFVVAAGAQKLGMPRCARLPDGPGRDYCRQFVAARDSYNKFKSASDWARFATDSCEFARAARRCFRRAQLLRRLRPRRL